MSCSEWERPVALLAGGDLADDQECSVRAHLVECVACAELYDELLTICHELRDAGGPEPFAVTSVRVRVMKRLRLRRAARRWAAAACVVLAMFAASHVMRHVHRRPAEVASVARTVPAVKVADSPVVAGMSESPDGRPHVRRRHRSSHVVTTARGSKQVVVKLVTEDPDVVIYWISD